MTTLIKIKLTNFSNLPPLDYFKSSGHDSHANCGAHDAVCAGDRIIENCCQNKPDTASEQSAHVAEHELGFGALEYHRIENALAYRAAHLGANEYRAENLEDCGQDACLLKREHFGAHACSERVCHVVGADAKCENECNYEPAYHHPELSITNNHLLFC